MSTGFTSASRRGGDSKAAVRAGSSLRRTLVYALLGGASLVFITPFLWLISSSLKPPEQAMALPPTLLPHAYYATIDGQRTEVTVDFTLQKTGVVADVSSGEQTGHRIFLTPEQALNRSADLSRAHRVGAGWIHVTQRRGARSDV